MSWEDVSGLWENYSQAYAFRFHENWSLQILNHDSDIRIWEILIYKGSILIHSSEFMFNKYIKEEGIVESAKRRAFLDARFCFDVMADQYRTLGGLCFDHYYDAKIEYNERVEIVDADN